MPNLLRHLYYFLTMPKRGYVYIMSNKNRTTFYIGVTNNLERRVAEHKSGTGSMFTGRYNLHYLVYFEIVAGMKVAIDREKQLKRWHRDWRINLIKAENPEMKDLSSDWSDPETSSG